MNFTKKDWVLGIILPTLYLIIPFLTNLSIPDNLMHIVKEILPYFAILWAVVYWSITLNNKISRLATKNKYLQIILRRGIPMNQIKEILSVEDLLETFSEPELKHLGFTEDDIKKLKDYPGDRFIGEALNNYKTMLK